jgi:hypothetical protein
VRDPIAAPIFRGRILKRGEKPMLGRLYLAAGNNWGLAVVAIGLARPGEAKARGKYMDARHRHSKFHRPQICFRSNNSKICLNLSPATLPRSPLLTIGRVSVPFRRWRVALCPHTHEFGSLHPPKLIYRPWSGRPPSHPWLKRLYIRPPPPLASPLTTFPVANIYCPLIYQPSGRLT